MTKAPDKWSSGRFEDFIFLQRGFDLTQKHSNPGKVPVITSSGFSYYHDTKMVDPPGIVTGPKGSLGKVWFVDVPYWPHDTTLWVKDFKGNDPRFVKIFLERLNLEKFDAATSVPTLNRNNLHGIKVLFPPLPEQKKIAEILSCWDSAIETIEKLIDAKTRFKKGLVKGLFQNKEFKRTQLKNVAVINMGQSPKSSEYNSEKEGLPLIQGKADIKNRKTCAQLWTRSFPKVANAGEIIMTVRAPVGHVAISTEKVCLGRGVCAISATKVGGRYLFQLLQSLESMWVRLEQGSTFTAVNSKDIRSLKVPIPNDNALETKIATLLDTADQEIDNLNSMMTCILSQKKGLMQQLLTGKVRVSTSTPSTKSTQEEYALNA